MRSHPLSQRQKDENRLHTRCLTLLKTPVIWCLWDSNRVSPLCSVPPFTAEPVALHPMVDDESGTQEPASAPQEATSTATSSAASTNDQADQAPRDKADAADHGPPPFKPTTFYNKHHPHCRPSVSKDDLTALNDQRFSEGLDATFSEALPSDLQLSEWVYVGTPEPNQFRLGRVIRITQGVPTVWYTNGAQNAPVFEELHEDPQIMQIARVPELTLPALASRSPEDPKDYIKSVNAISKTDADQRLTRIDYLDTTINDLIDKKSYITADTVKDALNETKKSKFAGARLGMDSKNLDIVMGYFAKEHYPPSIDLTGSPTFIDLNVSPILDKLNNLRTELLNEMNTFRIDLARTQQAQQTIHDASSKSADQSGPKLGHAGHMPRDGYCTHHLIKTALDMVNGEEFDKITFKNTVKEGKALVIAGACAYMDSLRSTLSEDGTSTPEEEFANTIGNSAQELIQALSGGRPLNDVNSKVSNAWAGSSELALSSYGKPYKIIIIHADCIHSAQTGNETAKHVHALSLPEDCDKEQVVYAILEEGHYMLGL